MLFDKILKESSACTKARFSYGQIVNYISSDSTKMQFTIFILPQMIINPFKIFIYVYILFIYFGISFLAGFIILIIYIFFNMFLQKKRREIEKFYLEAKDLRMKISTEALNYLKLIKLYSWEDEFSKRIGESRIKEIAQIRRKWNYSILSIYLVVNCPIFICIASILVYSMIIEELKLSNILLLITTFNNIQEPVRLIPVFLNFINETLVGFKRIQVNLSFKLELPLSR